MDMTNLIGIDARRYARDLERVRMAMRAAGPALHPNQCAAVEEALQRDWFAAANAGARERVTEAAIAKVHSLARGPSGPGPGGSNGRPLRLQLAA